MHPLIAQLNKPLSLRRPHVPRVQFSPTGTSAFLAFPRWPELGESDALDALDDWLGEHPTCSVVLLNELPAGRILKRVQKICKKHGCAYMVCGARVAVATA